MEVCGSLENESLFCTAVLLSRIVIFASKTPVPSFPVFHLHNTHQYLLRAFSFMLDLASLPDLLPHPPSNQNQDALFDIFPSWLRTYYTMDYRSFS